MRLVNISRVGSFESEALARFEGEGGAVAPFVNLLNIPFHKIMRRRPWFMIYQENQKEMTGKN